MEVLAGILAVWVAVILAATILQYWKLVLWLTVFIVTIAYVRSI